jgi:peptidoglycan/LPS O-acetylase OafA/YrhL
MSGTVEGQVADSSTAAIAAVPKRHYLILDGLRGVAAITVVIFHLSVVYSYGDRFKLLFGHAYLAVDFFYLLSGFVVAYAYDDRWGRMSQADFYKRRLIRLQPMVMMGMTIGALLFYLPAGHRFPQVATTPVWVVLLLMLMGYVMMPVPVRYKVHGQQEMFPLDSFVWSLFYEYIANVLYAVGLRKLSNRALGVFVASCGVYLIHLAVFGGQGDLEGGWSFSPSHLQFGFTRILFSFFAGILLMRCGLRIHVKGGFWICNALLLLALCLPRFGGAQHVWQNGVYESLCVVVLFPIIVAMGASERITDGIAIQLSRFSGDLSYPLYVTHYAFTNMYTAWVVDHKVPAGRGAVVGTFVFLASVALAYASLKLYDEPVRRWLGRRFLPRAQKASGG